MIRAEPSANKTWSGLASAIAPPAMPANATISTPFTTRLAAYMPRKSCSCCSRATQSDASSAGSSATAAQTIASSTAPRSAVGNPPARASAIGERATARSKPRTAPAASSQRATRRCIAARSAGPWCAQAGSSA